VRLSKRLAGLREPHQLHRHYHGQPAKIRAGQPGYLQLVRQIADFLAF
jgi:hypothetical protein